VVDERQFAGGFIVRPSDELAILVERDRRLGDEQRPPETHLDFLADVVTDTLLVQSFEIECVRGNDDVAQAAHVVARPCPRFGFAVTNHPRSFPGALQI